MTQAIRILTLTSLLMVGAHAAIPVGVAKVDVTPTHPVVLAGYGSRQTEFEGIDTKLWARAMVIGGQRPVVIVALDNCGVPAGVKTRLVKQLHDTGITTDRLVVAVTHTHNAPNLVGYASVLWAGRLNAEQEKRIEAYTDWVIEQMAAAVRAALSSQQPCTLEWGKGLATFGGNRRVLVDGKWSGFGFQRDGPVDHSLPVLVAHDANGSVHAVWANYACHCTTVGSRNHVGGDWAGYANENLEKAFPNAMALTTIGCGADVGPQPSGGLTDAKRHGASLADQVKTLVSEAGAMKPLTQEPQVSQKRLALPLAANTDRKHWAKRLESDKSFDKELARSMVSKADAGGIPTTVDYRVTAWSFGEDLAMVFLPGEVVVDYSVRLNRELDWQRLWITAWANAMPGYIPSRRVLEEGGYEAEFSQVYYDQPGRYLPEVEDTVVNGVTSLLDHSFQALPGQTPAPFHRLPSNESQTIK